jgi:hypothetical protein
MCIFITKTPSVLKKSFHNTSIHNTYTKTHFKIIIFFFLKYQAITANGPSLQNIFFLFPGSKNLTKSCKLYNLWQTKFRGCRSVILAGRLLTPQMRVMKLKYSQKEIQTSDNLQVHCSHKTCNTYSCTCNMYRNKPHYGVLCVPQVSNPCEAPASLNLQLISMHLLR